MPVRRYRRHDPAGRAKYQELKQLARSQRRVLTGSPGTLKQRTQSGHQYWVREHIRVDGKKTDEYLGPASSVARAAVDRLAEEIELAKALAAGSGQLRLLGYQRIDKKPAAVLEVLFNRGLFTGGLTLVGSHAYGALLNEMGIQAAGYKTQDIDLARAQRLEIALPGHAGLKALQPFAPFKLPGAETLAVDLLVAGTKPGAIVRVEELGAYAQAIPFLDFLIGNAIESIVLSPNQVIPVLIPAPERFAVHKLYSSQSRARAARDKIGKDLQQAAVLAAALEDETPGSIDEAFRAFPAAGKSAARRGAVAAGRLVDDHAEARRVLDKIARR